MPQVCDYQGTDYQKEFWQGADRRYEDAAERLVLERLLPKRGGSIIDLGAGFGRLTPVYAPRFQKVVVFDYAQDLLDQARRELPARLKPADLAKVEFCQGDIYRLPFADGSFEAVVSVRVAHHLEDLPAALREMNRILRPGGTLLLEFANKRNVLEILRWLFGRPNAAPFDRRPFARGRLFYNFHPGYVQDQLRSLGLVVEQRKSALNFRLPVIKRFVPAPWLARLDLWLMNPLGWLGSGPSLYLKVRKKDAA